MKREPVKDQVSIMGMKYFYAALAALVALSASRVSIAYARKLDAQTELDKYRLHIQDEDDLDDDEDEDEEETEE